MDLCLRNFKKSSHIYKDEAEEAAPVVETEPVVSGEAPVVEEPMAPVVPKARRVARKPKKKTTKKRVTKRKTTKKRVTKKKTTKKRVTKKKTNKKRVSKKKTKASKKRVSKKTIKKRRVIRRKK